MTDAYRSAVGFASAEMLSLHPVFATGTGTSTIWNRFSRNLQDIYGQVFAISTIVAYLQPLIQGGNYLQQWDVRKRAIIHGCYTKMHT